MGLIGAHSLSPDIVIPVCMDGQLIAKEFGAGLRKSLICTRPVDRLADRASVGHNAPLVSLADNSPGDFFGSSDFERAHRSGGGLSDRHDLLPMGIEGNVVPQHAPSDARELVMAIKRPGRMPILITLQHDHEVGASLKDCA